MIWQSRYDTLEGTINKFPVYKINNLEYTIYPTTILSIYSHEKKISFTLDTSKRIIDISKNDLIKASNKIKKFLLNHFDRVIEYNENWDRYKIEFTITYYYEGE